MDFHDLDEARALHGALMEIFVAHTGGRDNPGALARVDQLADAATAAIDDVECRVALRGVKSYSKLLFSEEGHLGIDAGSLTGEQIERLGVTLMRQSEEIDCLRKAFGLEEQDLDLDLGPLGRLF